MEIQPVRRKGTDKKMLIRIWKKECHKMREGGRLNDFASIQNGNDQTTKQ